jgi:hypothetical protein
MNMNKELLNDENILRNKANKKVARCADLDVYVYVYVYGDTDKDKDKDRDS